MKSVRFQAVALVVAMAAQAVPCRAADNLLGLYAGGGVGRATVRNDQILLTVSEFTGDHRYRLSFQDHEVGWMLFAGLRPSRWLGGEVDYIDFGRAEAPLR